MLRCTAVRAVINSWDELQEQSELLIFGHLYYNCKRC